ncbi:MAG: DNA replication/repair protein RecF [Acidobacteria bacterium]|nr:DNA replication/repair protein RecF [Acidobacteriota bacterium]
MHLKKLRLFQYRNIKDLEIVPSEGTTLFIGMNGQGKTNLLEAIYFLAFGRSFRTSVPRECIQHGEMECRIEGTVVQGSISRDLQVRIAKKEKKLFLHGKPVSLDAFVGNLHLLAFTYNHLNVVRKSPGDRRAFLDRAMATIYPGHIGSLAVYGRALKQRNRVLSEAREGKRFLDGSLLDSWDETLVKQGTRILSNRMRYVEQMKQNLPQGLFGREDLKMHYQSNVLEKSNSMSGIEEKYKDLLFQVRDYDCRIGNTSVGPHRDDLKLFVNGKSLVDFGSAGQQRSSLLALYFSQMEIHRGIHGFYPVLLVDDVEAELDEHRLNTFLKYLSQRTQTLLTSAKNFQLPDVSEDICHMEVHNGMIKKSEN